MFVLFIDTVTPRNRIGILREKEILYQHAWLANQNEAEMLLPTIQNSLEKSGHKLKDITHILAVTGPGRFTSTRVGITIANTIAYGLQVPIAGIHRLELLALPFLTTSDTSSPVNLYLESEKSDFYHYSRGSEGNHEGVKLSEEIAKEEAYMIFAHNGEVRESSLSEQDKSQPIDTLQALAHQISGDYFSWQTQITPLYVREANVTLRKKR